MTTAPYVYRVANVVRVVDGDTYDLALDVGFRVLMTLRIRLLGYDCPESRKGSAFERGAASSAKAEAAAWFASVDLAPAGGVLWVRTEKDPDDFGRWLGEVWMEDDRGGRPTLLGNWLRSLSLASVWPKRWREEFDPGGPQ
jgi:micrococcal nuclease